MFFQFFIIQYFVIDFYSTSCYFSQDMGMTRKIIDVQKNPVIVPSGSAFAEVLMPHLKRVPEEQLMSLAGHYNPYLSMNDEKQLELVGRIIIYQMLVARNIFNIEFSIFDNKSDLTNYINNILPKEKLYLEVLTKSYLTPASKGTIYRHKAIDTHRICQFCGDALMRPVGSWQADEQGFFRVHCYHSKQGRCDCYLLLTNPEKIKFENYEFNTSLHICKIPGKTCPLCGQDIYLRIIHLPDGSTLYYEICRNYRMSTKKTCAHKVKLQGPPQ